MPATITISSPSAGSQWTTGQTMTIQWTPFFTGDFEYTTFNLYKGTKDHFIGMIDKTGFVKTGSVDWTIPLWGEDTFPSGNDYFIEILVADWSIGQVVGTGESAKFTAIRSTTTTTTPGSTTTTTTLPVTTTTTTIPALLTVKTSLYQKVNNRFIETQSSDASDNSLTRNRPFAQSLNFGTLAPGETSKTMIVALNVPLVKGIKNIRLGLINTGGLTFTTSTFGYNSSIELRSDITPDYYFQGINTHEPTPTDTDYTIAIDRRDRFNSSYVYLNIKTPLNQTLGFGIIKFKWYFEYAD